MAIKKRTTGAVTATTVVGCGAAYANLRRVDFVASSDTTTAVTVTDADGVTVATFVSADYTTKARRYIGPVETAVYDTAGDPSADLEGMTQGVIVHSPLTFTISGVGTGTVTADAFVEV